MDKKDICLRAASVQDAEALLDIYAPYVLNTAITFEYEVPSVQEFADRISQTLKKYPYLVAEKGDEILGYAYAGAFNERASYDWAVSTTIYVKKDVKKMGLGRMLYESLEKVLFTQNVLNLYACIAYPTVEDAYLTKNSMEFHHHFGYRFVGEFRRCGYKFNRWYNMVWMEKEIGDHLERQPPIKIFPDVRDIIWNEYGIR